MPCDNCHVARALTLWALFREDGSEAELDLCGHDSDRNAEAMVTRGWALIHDERVEDVLPRLAPLSSDPATH